MHRILSFAKGLEGIFSLGPRFSLSPRGGPSAGPPGGYPPGPAQPPPGSPYPGGWGAQSYQPPPPPPASGGSGLKFLLIGCGLILFLGVGSAVGGILLCANKGSEMMSGLMGVAEQDFINKLSDDHTDEEIERVRTDFQAFNSEIERLGFVNWSQQYETEFRELQFISADNVITVEESQRWCDNVETALEEAGYYGD